MDFRAKRIFFNFVGAILAMLLVATSFFALTNVVFNLVYVKTLVYQISMYPTINSTTPDPNKYGDQVYMNKFAAFTKGDIVVANVDWYPDPIIKRLVATPYDELFIKDTGNEYTLFVNDAAFYSVPKNNEWHFKGDGGTTGYYLNYLEYVATEAEQDATLNRQNKRIITHPDGTKAIKLYADEYFLMGDNWPHSTDCTTYGPATRKQIMGKVDIIIHYGSNIKLELFKSMLKTIFSF